MATRLIDQVLRRLRAVPPVRRALRRLNDHRRQPDWSALGNPPAPAAETSGPRANILFATSVGALPGVTTFDSLIAMALRMRGARVETLLCDAALPACQLCQRMSVDPEQDFIGQRPEQCGSCHPPAERMFAALNIPTHRYSAWLSPDDVARIDTLVRTTKAGDIPSFTDHGVPIGEHAMSGCLRYFGRGDLNGEPAADAMLRRYFAAALRVRAALTRLLASHTFDRVVIQHGIYVPQGVIRDTCRVLNVPVVAWERGYRDRTFILCHGDTHHRALGAEPESVWHRPLSASERTRLHDYLRSRRTGSADWVSFQRSPAFDLSQSPALASLDDRPRIAMLTSVAWDARIHYPSNAFPDMLAWVLATIQHVERRPDLVLIIRVHPAEVHGVQPSRQRIVDELARLYPTLPENVRLVPPGDPISTYAITDTCNAAVIYNTKTGIELAPTGLPVIVAGEAWVKGRGFTIDVSSPEEYAAALDELPCRQRLTADQIARAEAFAHHVFFRRMLSIPLLRSARNQPYHHDLRSWDQLRPAADANLDVVCRGILEGTPFEAVAW